MNIDMAQENLINSQRQYSPHKVRISSQNDERLLLAQVFNISIGHLPWYASVAQMSFRV